jgi:hypothetical protein
MESLPFRARVERDVLLGFELPSRTSSFLSLYQSGPISKLPHVNNLLYGSLGVFPISSRLLRLPDRGGPLLLLAISRILQEAIWDYPQSLPLLRKATHLSGGLKGREW